MYRTSEAFSRLQSSNRSCGLDSWRPHIPPLAFYHPGLPTPCPGLPLPLPLAFFNAPRWVLLAYLGLPSPCFLPNRHATLSKTIFGCRRADASLFALRLLLIPMSEEQRGERKWPTAQLNAISPGKFLLKHTAVGRGGPTDLQVPQVLTTLSLMTCTHGHRSNFKGPI
jgi:hypothetical protein